MKSFAAVYEVHEPDRTTYGWYCHCGEKGKDFEIRAKAFTAARKHLKDKHPAPVKPEVREWLTSRPTAK